MTDRKAIGRTGDRIPGVLTDEAVAMDNYEFALSQASALSCSLGAKYSIGNFHNPLATNISARSSQRWSPTMALFSM